jgi:ATP-binding cassette, subfamily F, member 3
MLRAFAARRVGNVPSNVTVHYVTQDVHLTEKMKQMTPVEIVVEADIELRLLLEESNKLDMLADKGELDEKGQLRQAEVLERLDMIGADSAARRADELLVNLGFSDELRSRNMQALSGGWRVRTMLAAAIFARPDMLLLDEPTNHLSITAVLWLARELKESQVWKDRIIVIVSHDRYFLDEVCTDVLHISGAARRLTQSHGNYTTWAARRLEQQQVFEKETKNRQNEIDKMKEFAGHGFKYGGSSNSINKMKMLEKQAGKLEVEANDQAEELAALQEDIELPLKMKSGGELPGFIVQMKQVAFGYPGSKVLYANADFSVTSNIIIIL